MARIPHSPDEAVEDLGLEGRVLLVGPPPGYAEAIGSGAVVAGVSGDQEGSDDGEPVPAVVVWVGAVPVHEVRTYTGRVSGGGVLWVVLPKSESRGPAKVSEADLVKSLLIKGWRSDRKLASSPDTYAPRFRRRVR